MKKIILALLFTASYLITRGQTATLQNVIPPSPEAGAFVKYGTYNVSTFTGRPDINIPLYQIQTKNFSLPISLSYDATGIKVNDLASWVGMNFTLNVGGMISRTVISNPDEDPYGYLQSPPPRTSTLTDNATSVNYLKAITKVASSPTNYDTAPDLYNYSFNGRSGTFMFKSDKSIMQIPQTSLKITCDFTNFNFKIVDENGITYLFNTVEQTQIENGMDPQSMFLKTIRSGWYLTEIISADKTEHVYFNYETNVCGPYTTYDVRETFGQKYINNTLTNNVHTTLWFGMQRTMYYPRLTSIVYSLGKVVFNRVQDRLDDMGSRLDEITVYAASDSVSYTKLKSFKMSQGYYYSTQDYSNDATFNYTPTSKDRYRLRLDTIKVKNAQGANMYNYSFSYNATMLPPKTSCGQDWWGYANGAPNRTLVPPAQTATGFAIGGAVRTPDSVSMKAGILEQIKYPTGGTTVFEMEPHKYISTANSMVTASYGASARGIDAPGVAHQQTLTFNNTAVGLATISLTIGPYSTSGNPAYTSPADQANASLPPYVKIKNLSNGVETVYNSPNPANYYSTTINNFQLTGTSYEITAYCYANQSSSLATITVSFSTISSVPQTKLAGGLRVKSIKSYTASNVLASQENYTYGLTENGIGTFAGIDASSATSYTVSEQAKDPLATYFPSGQYTAVNYDVYTSGCIFDQTLLQGSPVVYGYVTKYNGDVNNNTGKTVYHYNDVNLIQTAPLPAGMALVNNMGILITNDYWKRGNLLWEKNYRKNADGTYQRVAQVSNTYKDTVTSATYQFLGAVRVYLSPSQEANYHLGNFSYAEQPVNTGYVQLLKTDQTETPIDTLHTYLSSVQYNYDTVHPDIRSGSASVNSENQTNTQTIKYPFNKSQLQSAYALTTVQSAAIDSMLCQEHIDSGRNLKVCQWRPCANRQEQL